MDDTNLVIRALNLYREKTGVNSKFKVGGEGTQDNKNRRSARGLFSLSVVVWWWWWWCSSK